MSIWKLTENICKKYGYNTDKFMTLAEETAKDLVEAEGHTDDATKQKSYELKVKVNFKLITDYAHKLGFR